MGLEEFRSIITDEIKGIISSEFNITVKDTMCVPTIDDPDITYPNLDTKEQKCKMIETCVLYIDIRRSTDLNLNHRQATMAKLYSAFVRAMTKAGSYYGGKVRNIIGDRVMIVFDAEDCFKNAVNTAILMNSVSTYVIDKQFPHNEIKCGIGIDYGKMLVTKTGVIKNGKENVSNKSLVWLGRPANVASKLTDSANKKYSESKIIEVPTVHEGHKYSHLSDLQWYSYSQDEFLNKRIEANYTSPTLKHIDDSFRCFFTSTKFTTNAKEVSIPSILMSKEVYEGFKKAVPSDASIEKNLWHIQKDVSISGYNGEVYGGDVIFTSFLDKN
ncbi:adenylate/guanylate cyclase domain-containing protein [Bacillus toyonensis]